jgi:hypothetical protein
MASTLRLDWISPVSRWDESSVILRPIVRPYGGVLWACRITFRATDDSVRGTAEFGLESGSGFSNQSQTGCKWGGNDTVAAGSFRGSLSSLGYGISPNKPNYEWQTGRDYYLRVYKSPKQNWLAAELDSGSDQAAGEIAWRFTVTDLSTGTVTTVRDILIPDCATTGAMSDGSIGAEDTNTATAPVAKVPWDVRWSEPRVNNRLVPSTTITYSSGGDSLNNTNSHADDRIGFRQQSRTKRVNAAAVTLNHPGAVLRHWTMHAVGNQPATDTITVNTPSGAAIGDRLVALVAHDWADTVTTPSGWKFLGTAGLGYTGARISAFTRVLAVVPPASYSFVKSSAAYPILAAVMLDYMGADLYTDPALGGDTTSADLHTWSAPALTKPTNFGRVIIATAVRPYYSSFRDNTTFNAVGSPLYRANTNDITNDWITLAVAEEATTDVVATALAKGGSTWQGVNVGVQLMVYPALQRLRPSSDLSVGEWTAAPLWEKIDEIPPDNADFILGSDGAICEIDLGAGALTDPQTAKGHALRYRVRRLNADASGSLLVELLQGTSTVIASKTQSVPAGDTFIDGALVLSAGQANSITNYTNLRFRLTAMAS